MTNAEPSEYNSVSTSKMTEITVTKVWFERVEFIGDTTVPLCLPESPAMTC